MSKHKILVNAYACSPNMGSEPGMAWNWCVNLAKYYELHIITEGEFRSQIEEALITIPQRNNMHFYYNQVSEKVRRICWNQGDWRFYFFYNKWQIKTLEIAKNIVSLNSISAIHQLNMIGFREPGYLWKLGLPFIWGPINAKEGIPLAYLDGAPFKNKMFIRLKNLLNRLQLRYSSRVNYVMKHADAVIAASSDSVNSIKKYYNITPYLLNESGCTPESIVERNWDRSTLDVLWVGRFIFTKQLDLALEVISKLSNINIRFHVVGGDVSDEVKFKEQINNLGISGKCEWYGKISHKEVINLMRKSHIFLFTSIAEGTPHVVLEAIGVGLPVLCFDTCGQGDVVNDHVGKKIPLSTPEKSIRDFADQIIFWDKNRNLLKQLSQNCTERQLELSWPNKLEQMIEIYNSCLKRDSC